MDSLQAVLAAQAPMFEALDQDEQTDGAALQAAAAVLPGDISSAPLFPAGDEALAEEAGEVVDGTIFAALVAG